MSRLIVLEFRCCRGCIEYFTSSWVDFVCVCSFGYHAIYGQRLGASSRVLEGDTVAHTTVIINVRFSSESVHMI